MKKLKHFEQFMQMTESDIWFINSLNEDQKEYFWNLLNELYNN